MQDVEAEVRVRVPEVAGVVGRDPAHVEADGAVADRPEQIQPAAPRVVEAEAHGAIIPMLGRRATRGDGQEPRWRPGRRVVTPMRWSSAGTFTAQPTPSGRSLKIVALRGFQ